MLSVTSCVAAVLTVIYIRLALAIIRLRKANLVSLGSGGRDDLEKAIRAHGNFAEYVPFGLILLACLELNGATWYLVAILGLGLVVGRVCHAHGINRPTPDFRMRVLGMQFTFFTLILLAALNVIWVAAKPFL